MGFGHRVYKNYDPRAKVIKAACDKVLPKLKRQDPLLDIARHLEEAALKDPYFVDRKLYPNVDFYSGLIYRAMGIPTNMFTVMFAIGRLPGWLAHWKEMIEDPATKIGRPAPDLHRARRSPTTFRWNNGNSRRDSSDARGERRLSSSSNSSSSARAVRSGSWRAFELADITGAARITGTPSARMRGLVDLHRAGLLGQVALGHVHRAPVPGGPARRRAPGRRSGSAPRCAARPGSPASRPAWSSG